MDEWMERQGFLGKPDPSFELSPRIDAAGGLTCDNVYRSNHQEFSESGMGAGCHELSTVVKATWSCPSNFPSLTLTSSRRITLPWGVLKRLSEDFSKRRRSCRALDAKGAFPFVQADVEGIAATATAANVPAQRITQQLAATSLSDRI
jgi:hypothetical protein